MIDKLLNEKSLAVRERFFYARSNDDRLISVSFYNDKGEQRDRYDGKDEQKRENEKDDALRLILGIGFSDRSSEEDRGNQRKDEIRDSGNEHKYDRKERPEDLSQGFADVLRRVVEEDAEKRHRQNYERNKCQNGESEEDVTRGFRSFFNAARGRFGR